MMLNYVVIAATVFLIPFGILSIIQGNRLVGIFDLSSFFLITITVIYYKKTLNYHFLTYVLISVLGTLFLVLLYSSGVDYSGHLWSYIFPISIMFMVGRHLGLVLSTVFFVIANFLLMIAVSQDIYSISFHLRFLGSFTAVTVISYYMEYVRERMHEQLKEKNSKLEYSLIQLAKKETSLAEKERHYRTLFEASNDALFLMDEDVFTDCNPATLKIFNCKREDIIGKSPLVFSTKFQPDGNSSKQKAIELINDALNNKPQIFEWIHTKLDGTEFLAEVNLNLVYLDNRKHLLASVRDITERKKAEDELKKAKEKAERSDRLKSDFLAQMSHEIRTPINTIMNYTSLLKMEFENNVSEDNKDSFKSIQNAAIRLLRTIDLILNISDLEAGTYEPRFEKIDLAENVVVPVINEFKQTAELKNIALNFSVTTTESPLAIVDGYTVTQIIANLVDNSIKYTESGEVRVKITKRETLVKVEIKDTGVGISNEYLPKLFEKFTQEEAGYTRRFEGSGLGLALVKKYCEINNIKISVKSKKQEGTIFILEIPISQN